METEEYNTEPEGATTKDDADVAMNRLAEEKFTDVQPTTGDWSDIDAKAASDEKSESETEPDEDSDNVDVEGSDVDEDWYAVRAASTEGNDEDTTIPNPSSGKVRISFHAARQEHLRILVRRKWAKVRRLWNTIPSLYFDTC